ncbi:MAG: acyltransferase family protein [Planctomycetota bacterium]|jgi:predicted acyltransferase
MTDLQEPEITAHEPKVPLTSRVMSIDAVRGFDMFWIIGGSYIFNGLHTALNIPTTTFLKNQLTHVEWEGFVFEDLIMPLFLFIVGVVMPYSFNKRLERGDSKRKLYIHVVLRSVILFVLGMIAQGNLLDLDLSKLKIYCNTLQAIAAGYLISAIIILNMRVRWQIVTTVLLLLLFWALMMLVPFPGRVADRLNQDANLAAFIDRVILDPFDDGLNYTWILSSITFACTVMLGVMAGHLLRTDIPGPHKVRILVFLGIGTLALGALWGGWFFGIGKFYAGLFPIIKRLWTSSFVLFSAGLSYLLLAVFYLVIDVWGFKKWAYGFVVIGTNAIFVYMLTHLINFRSIASVFVGGLDQFVGPWKDFIHAVAGFVLVLLILFWMYRKKTFIKV